MNEKEYLFREYGIVLDNDGEIKDLGLIKTHSKSYLKKHSGCISNFEKQVMNEAHNKFSKNIDLYPRYLMYANNEPYYFNMTDDKAYIPGYTTVNNGKLCIISPSYKIEFNAILTMSDKYIYASIDQEKTMRVPRFNREKLEIVIEGQEIEVDNISKRLTSMAETYSELGLFILNQYLDEDYNKIYRIVFTEDYNLLAACDRQNYIDSSVEPDSNSGVYILKNNRGDYANSRYIDMLRWNTMIPVIYSMMYLMSKYDFLLSNSKELRNMNKLDMLIKHDLFTYQKISTAGSMILGDNNTGAFLNQMMHHLCYEYPELNRA